MSLELLFAIGVVATRLLQILAGMLLCVLGYRLFERVRSIHGQAEITLSQHLKLNLSKVGPGVFFALFGAAVLVQALRSPMRLERDSGAPATATIAATPATAGATANAPTAATAVTTATRERLVIAGARAADPPVTAVIGTEALAQHLRFLNHLPNERRSGLPIEQQVAFEVGQREAKLALLRAGWDVAWGDAAEFAAWARGERPDKPAARAIELWNSR